MPVISEKVRITNISRYDKDRDGKPLKTKDGRLYTRITIQTEEYEGKQLSGFGNAENQNWQIGDEIEIIIEERNGYLNFRQPKRDDVIDAKLDQILAKLEGIEENLSKRP